jgi:hypothetical protein
MKMWYYSQKFFCWLLCFGSFPSKYQFFFHKRDILLRIFLGTSPVNIPIILLFSVFKSMFRVFSFLLKQSNVFDSSNQNALLLVNCLTFYRTKKFGGWLGLFGDISEDILECNSHTVTLHNKWNANRRIHTSVFNTLFDLDLFNTFLSKSM